MAQTRWYRERKGEAFYRRAKREGYRARSAYKLKQIQERFEVIRKGDTVVDLGASPGGWSQVAAELAGPNGLVVGVDLEPVKPLAGAVFVRGDLTQAETVARVKRALAERARARVDVVLSDMSPSLTGTYTMDQANSFWLASHALAFAAQVLKPGGHFVAKLFEGEDTPAFVGSLKSSFQMVKPFGPEASRKQSSEVFFVAKGFRGVAPPAPA